MKFPRLTLVTLVTALLGSLFAQSMFDPNSLPGDLKFDDLFPRKGFSGRVASAMSWSHDDRYIGYLWNPYDVPGGDLWLYDTKEGKSVRVTSIETFATMDVAVKRAIERYRKDKEDEAKRLAMSDKDYRDEVQRLREENEKRKEPLPSYPGVSEYEWAHKSDDILMVFKGDVLRWKIGQDKPTWVTRTKEAESSIEWLPDDSGFTFQRGANVFRVRFGSADVEQLNPDLPVGVNFVGYDLSPDGTRMMIVGSKPGVAERQVDYIVYRDRFAQVRKTGRSVSEDNFSGEQYLFTYNLSENDNRDGKPFQVWYSPSGEAFEELSLHENPWSADSTKLVFATWNRAKKELVVNVADPVKKKVENVFKTTSNGEHTSPGMANPFFTPDAKQIVLMLDMSGYRHAHVLDTAVGGARQLTRGEFECYPKEMSKDGKTLYVVALKEDTSQEDIYAVDFFTGDMKRLTSEKGVYGNPEFDHKHNRFASTFRSWSQMPEMFLVDSGRQKQITESHRSEAFFKNIRLKPELFTYQNRNGQTVHGYMFLPPGFKKTDKRPLMIYVYGGPLGTSRSVVQGSFGSTEYLFNMFLTYTLGYVTVTIDPRGQSGYGAAFGKANWDAPGVAQTEDLSDGVKFLIQNYGVDPAKVAINGWSFGGFQTQMCLYTAPNDFTLGIAGAGPTQWQNYNNWYVGGVIGQADKTKPDALDKHSLTHLAKNLRSPLLLLHGMEDTNVLFQDTIMVYRELLQMGKGSLVELAIDPTGGHGMGGDMNNRDRHAIYLAFILKHWGIPK